MYFFLCNLSFIDLCSTTTTVPLALVKCLRDCPTITYNDCYAQMTISLFLGMTECCLLAVMAYDRFVAISNPLRYTLIMTMRACFQIATIMWIGNFLLALIPMVTIPAQFCAGHNVVNHFVCEVVAVLKLVCSDTSVGETLLLINSIVIVPLPFLFILLSYIRIAVAVLKIPSTAGRKKAFSTCGSHLTVVTIYYGTIISIYVIPQNKDSKDRDKIISVFYGTVIPMVNPLIYTLRNKDVIGALRKAAGKTKKHGVAETGSLAEAETPSELERVPYNWTERNKDMDIDGFSIGTQQPLHFLFDVWRLNLPMEEAVDQSFFFEASAISLTDAFSSSTANAPSQGDPGPHIPNEKLSPEAQAIIKKLFSNYSSRNCPPSLASSNQVVDLDFSDMQVFLSRTTFPEAVTLEPVEFTKYHKINGILYCETTMLAEVGENE
ncbi:olfactory receptor 13H1-like [Tachyglossus aculeatus]|uniref:olfactory receptor 13H1-like n=1 Tax=Tachyglossus aculeatus TaxID=9261 RepID=UPI0018F590EA|nr:olfactory receptor 13H1-like [Tachyglossus aculeatus]